MSKGQIIFYIVITFIWLLLMIWCFAIKEYMAIIKSFFIMIGSAILGALYAILGDEE